MEGDDVGRGGEEAKPNTGGRLHKASERQRAITSPGRRSIKNLQQRYR